MSFLREGAAAFLALSQVPSQRFCTTTLSLAHSLVPGQPDTSPDPQLCQAHSCLWTITLVLSSARRAPFSPLLQDDSFSQFSSQLKCYLLTETFPWPMSFESLPQPLSMALNDTRNYLLVLHTLIAFILLRIRAGTLSVLFTWFLHSVVWHRVGTQ